MNCKLLPLLCLLLCSCKPQTPPAEPAQGEPALTEVTFQADSAMATLRAQCRLGARVPGTEAHRRCGDYLVQAFSKCGLQVSEQTGEVIAWDGRTRPCRNILAHYRPEATERVVLAAHWDSRPWADAEADTTLWRQPVLAANDGASGVSVLLEVARLLPKLQPKVGVDLICFDMEDMGEPQGQTVQTSDGGWCLGSKLWAERSAAVAYRARWGVLLDMVGSSEASFLREGFSLQYAEALVDRVWRTAERVGAGHLFRKADGGYATDDHVNMNQIAGVPTVDIINYDPSAQHPFGPTWHTTHDTPEHISPRTLQLVGQTLLQLLSEEQ